MQYTMKIYITIRKTVIASKVSESSVCFLIRQNSFNPKDDSNYFFDVFISDV